MIVEVVALPGQLLDAERKVTIVVDALRASSTIVAIFEAGAAEVSVAASPADAFELVGEQRERYLICGEQGGLPPPGFDCGNSPLQIGQLDLRGRPVVLTTSNGTRALLAVASTQLALVGSGRNGPTVAARALAAAEASSADLAIVCAGDEQGTLFSLEDWFFAGYLVECLAAARPFSWPVDEADPKIGDPAVWVLDESALAARRLYLSYLAEGEVDTLRPPPAVVQAMFREARNGNTLPRIGYGADLEYCAAVACSVVTPRLTQRAGRLLLTDAASADE